MAKLGIIIIIDIWIEFSLVPVTMVKYFLYIISPNSPISPKDRHYYSHFAVEGRGSQRFSSPVVSGRTGVETQFGWLPKILHCQSL